MGTGHIQNAGAGSRVGSVSVSPGPGVGVPGALARASGNWVDEQPCEAKKSSCYTGISCTILVCTHLSTRLVS